MRLSRFFIDDALALDIPVTPSDAVAHYMRHVLRLKDGQQVLLFNGHEHSDVQATVNVEGKQLRLKPLQRIDKNSESRLSSELMLAIGKPEHVDLALQKCTELGVSQFRLFNSERTQTPIRSNRLEKKLSHWRAVITSACEQCGRNLIPPLQFHASLDDCLATAAQGQRLILDFDGEPLTRCIEQFDGRQAFHMLIGAEGGLSQAEISLAKAQGFKGIYLGARVLRMETAAISMMALIQHRFGDLG